MAAQGQANEQFSDLITCAVCIDEFNERHRAPKFLTCSHTICLECLKNIAANGKVSCPLCRSVVDCPDGVQKLPNNSWALHMVEIKNRPTVLRWCWSCRSSAEQPCLDSHPTFLIDSSRLEDVHKLQRRASLHAARLERAKERGKSLGSYYNKILATLKSTVKDVENQMATHQLHLIHLASLTDEYHRIVGMIDSFQTVKESLERTIEESEQEIELSRRIWWEYDHRIRLKTAVHLFDEKNHKLTTTPVLEHGFGNDLQPYSRELELMRHSLFTYLKLQNVQLGPPDAAAQRSPSTMSDVKTKFKKILSGSKMLLSNVPLHSKPSPPGGGQHLSASHRWKREKLPQNSSRTRSLSNILDPREAEESVPRPTPSVGQSKNHPSPVQNCSRPQRLQEQHEPPPIPPRTAPGNPESATTPSGEQLPQLPRRNVQRAGSNAETLRFSPTPAARGQNVEPVTGVRSGSASYRPPVDTADDWLPLSGPASLNDSSNVQLVDLGPVTAGHTSVPCTPTLWSETFFDSDSFPPSTKPPPPPKPRTLYPSSTSQLHEFGTLDTF